MHLTSHRMTFHASLLSTRPDLAPHAQIIKSGPLIIHRPGFHRKKRRWIELSHDMLSEYKNATDEARARPIRSVLRMLYSLLWPHIVPDRFNSLCREKGV